MATPSPARGRESDQAEPEADRSSGGHGVWACGGGAQEHRAAIGRAPSVPWGAQPFLSLPRRPTALRLAASGWWAMPCPVGPGTGSTPEEAEWLGRPWSTALVPARWWAANRRGPAPTGLSGAPRAIDTPAQLLSASRFGVPSFTMEGSAGRSIGWEEQTPKSPSVSCLSRRGRENRTLVLPSSEDPLPLCGGADCGSQGQPRKEVREALVAPRLRSGACSSCQPWLGAGQGPQPWPRAPGHAGCCPLSVGSISTHPRDLGLPRANPRGSSKAWLRPALSPKGPAGGSKRAQSRVPSAPCQAAGPFFAVRSVSSLPAAC